MGMLCLLQLFHNKYSYHFAYSNKYTNRQREKYLILMMLQKLVQSYRKENNKETNYPICSSSHHQFLKNTNHLCL